MFLVLSCLAGVFAQSIEARCLVENEYVVGAVLTGDAPTTSEWSILLPTVLQENTFKIVIGKMGAFLVSCDNALKGFTSPKHISLQLGSFPMNH